MFEKVVDKLSEYLKIDKSIITKETNIVKDLNADSLIMVELLFSLEEECGITIPEDVVADFTTVGSIVSYLEKVI